MIIPNIWKNNIHVPNHQSIIIIHEVRSANEEPHHFSTQFSGHFHQIYHVPQLSIVHDISPFSWINYKNSACFFWRLPLPLTIIKYSAVVFPGGKIHQWEHQQKKSPEKQLQVLACWRIPTQIPMRNPWNQRVSQHLLVKIPHLGEMLRHLLLLQAFPTKKSPKKSPLSA